MVLIKNLIKALLLSFTHCELEEKKIIEAVSKGLSPCSATNYHYLKQSFALSEAGTSR